MNTVGEIKQAMLDLQNGKFVPYAMREHGELDELTG